MMNKRVSYNVPSLIAVTYEVGSGYACVDGASADNEVCKYWIWTGSCWL